MTAIIAAASAVGVADFRLSLKWPLVDDPEGPLSAQARAAALAQTCQELSCEGWRRVDGLEHLADGDSPEARSKAADDSYSEFAYLHDFLQNVLFPRQSAEPAVSIWRSDRIVKVKASLLPVDEPDVMAFALDRRTIHLLATGIAVVTLELRLVPRDDPPPHPPLTLDRVQKCIDHLRRSYAPFFIGSRPARCRVMVTLIGAETTCHATAGRAVTLEQWRKARVTAARDIPVFDH